MRSTARRKSATDKRTNSTLKKTAGPSATRNDITTRNATTKPESNTPNSDKRNNERDSRNHKTNTRALSVSTETISTNCRLTAVTQCGHSMRPLTAATHCGHLLQPLTVATHYDHSQLPLIATTHSCHSLRPLTATTTDCGTNSHRSCQPQTLNRASLVSLERGQRPPRRRPRCFPQHRGYVRSYVRTLRNQSRSFPSFRRCKRAKPRPRDRRA